MLTSITYVLCANILYDYVNKTPIASSREHTSVTTVTDVVKSVRGGIVGFDPVLLLFVETTTPKTINAIAPAVPPMIPPIITDLDPEPLGACVVRDDVSIVVALTAIDELETCTG